MGNSCCHAESPCGSAEERSGLLKYDPKVIACPGETVVVGTCGPEGDDDGRKTDEEAEPVPGKHSPENGETELSNTQENGPVQTESIQTTTPSPHKAPEVKENGTTAQDKDMKETPAPVDNGQAELPHCTLNSQQKKNTAAEWEIFVAPNAELKDKTDLVQDKVPDGVSLSEEVTCSETPPNTLTDKTTQHIIVSATHDGDGDNKEEACGRDSVNYAVAEPSEEFAQNNEVLPVPNAPLTAADQSSSISVVGQEIKSEPLSSSVTEDLDNISSSVCGEEAGSKDIKSHVVAQSSSGFESPVLDRSGEDQNSLEEPETTAAADASESLKSDQDVKPDLECTTTSSKEVFEQEMMPKVQDKAEDVLKMKNNKGTEEEEEEVKVEGTPVEAEIQAGKDAESQERIGKEEQPIASTKKEGSLGNSEEDLYRGAEELSASQKPGQLPSIEAKLLKVEDRCSLSPAVDILSYSEREWKGNTAKSALIKKGYKEMSQRFGSLRRVRGDNYCALRATLFQVLMHSTQLPTWLQDNITLLPKQLEAQEGLISEWRFPGECVQGDGTADTTQQLKGYMELLQNKWQAAVDCASAAERQQLCERVFQGGEEELGLLEALKLLMLGQAVELHGCMQAGEDVPLFCWLLFARDSSDCPRSFLSNHLSHVGLSAGLEQVEMFLLGYALQCTIQVYRLYKADTEEFVTYYPDDHKDDWQSVCLVTEDDRHYNVPVVEAAELHKELNSS